MSGDLNVLLKNGHYMVQKEPLFHGEVGRGVSTSLALVTLYGSPYLLPHRPFNVLENIDNLGCLHLRSGSRTGKTLRREWQLSETRGSHRWFEGLWQGLKMIGSGVQE
jgi:hypothetical protein